MDSLANYGSDDDYDSSEEPNNDPKPTQPTDRNRKPEPADANYEEVGMDLSEDSDGEQKQANRRSPVAGRRGDRDRGGGGGSRDERGRRGDDHRGGRSRDYDSSRRDDERRHRHKERDNHRRRSRSRDRRRSRTPKRSRSRSRDRNNRNFGRRHDRTGPSSKRTDANSVKPPDTQKAPEQNQQDQGRFFMPGITGRFREQIERRKMLWQKKTEPEKPEQAPATVATPLGGSGGSRATKVWETTTFAQDTDGKVASKFKRLMGIKNAGDSSAAPGEILKKQQEMFSSMEQQYEVARTATHTMRGVGLGFGSYQK